MQSRRWRVGVLLLVVVLSILFSARAQDLPPGTLLFVWFGDIYTTKFDDPEPTQLTFGLGADEPVWSPDGQKIAYTAAGEDNQTSEIFVMDSNGANPIQLTHNKASDGFISWSPDGNKIAFASDRDGNLEIYIMNRDGSDQINVTNHPDADYYPAWSPDGDLIAFVSNRNARTSSDIFTVDLSQGYAISMLTNDSAVDTLPGWSPDGEQIIFMRKNDDTCLSIYTMDFDGDNLKSISEPICDLGNILWPTDTNSILYVHNSVVYRLLPNGTGEELMIIGGYGSLVGKVDYLPAMPIATPTPDPETSLHDVLFSPDCERACWLGIQPGITTKEELEAILDANEIAYGVAVNDMAPNDQRFYYVFWDQNDLSLLPHAKPPSSLTILVEDGTVSTLSSLLVRIAVDEALRDFSEPPSAIVNSGDKSYIIYAEKGLVFSVSYDEGVAVHIVILTTPSSAISVYIDNVNTSPLQPCDEPVELCTLATKPPPTPTSTPSP